MEYIKARGVKVNGKKTSIRLEEYMWSSLKDIALREKTTIDKICTTIANINNTERTLTSKIRVFIMLYYKSAATEQGHRDAGHGSFDTAIRRKEKSENRAHY